jgi:hypothetical protein
VVRRAKRNYVNCEILNIKLETLKILKPSPLMDPRRGKRGTELRLSR